MQTATTLVHKGAMKIAVHAVSSFARHFAKTHTLQIHTDGSPDEEDCRILLQAASGMEATIVTPEERKDKVAEALRDYPESTALLGRGGYFCKLELPIWVEKPFFYFDSDIVWLRPVESFAPKNSPCAFSTESWSWYFGVSNDGQWVNEKIPRRVNSGFYYLTQEFPFDRLERMMKDGLFDLTNDYNTDQEIMAFLYPDMEYFHPEDLKRSRRNVHYDFAEENSAALHFPGKMWEPHFDQIEALGSLQSKGPMSLRFEPSVPLSHMELFKMRAKLNIAQLPVLRFPVNCFRSLRKKLAR